MDLVIKIEIKHKPSDGGFNKEQIISDIEDAFYNNLGYETKSVEINRI